MVKKQLDSKQMVIQEALDKDKEISKAYFKFKQSIRQKIIEWAEINQGTTTPLQAAKTDFGTSNKFETLVEHYLKIHDGDISELKQRIANTQIKTREN